MLRYLCSHLSHGNLDVNSVFTWERMRNFQSLLEQIVLARDVADDIGDKTFDEFIHMSIGGRDRGGVVGLVESLLRIVDILLTQYKFRIIVMQN